MNKLIQFGLFLFSTFVTFSQGITAYEDFRGNLVVFDKGKTKTIETQSVQNFGIGGKCIPYIDNFGYFKIYHDSKVDEITYGPNILYTVTDNLISYSFNEQLWVYDNGTKELLSVWVENYQVSDHTVAYLDNNDNEFSVYQNKEKTKLEDVLSGVNDIDYKVAENVVAYNFMDQFKIFINGESFEINFNNKPESYKVGRNIVAYVDGIDQSFKSFYLGEEVTLEDFTPEWYKVADDMIIYKDQVGTLKAFHKGETYTLSTNEPTSVSLGDNLCTFIDQEQYKVFYNGKITTLEYSTPKGSTIENNSVIYQDLNGTLKYFNGTEGEVVTSELIGNYNVNLNTITFTNLANRTKVFYKGSIYY